MWTVWCSPSFLCSILTQYQLVLLHVYFCSLHLCIMYLHVCTSKNDQITARRRRTADERQAKNNIKPVINYAPYIKFQYTNPWYKFYQRNKCWQKITLMIVKIVAGDGALRKDVVLVPSSLPPGEYLISCQSSSGWVSIIMNNIRAWHQQSSC